MNISIVQSMQISSASRQLKTNACDSEKSTEKLSSGYRINRAADDAAGLTISEKMRLQLRGLQQGTSNALDGVSWLQIGDGALGEVHDVLHRMTELAIASASDTYTHADRAAMQDEFEQLQQEIDHITDSANFNTKHIFDEHEATYYQFEGNVQWDYRQLHQITDYNNDLKIRYRETEDGPSKELSFKIENGVYTTQELIDEIDDAMLASGMKKDGIYLEYTSDGFCNVNYEGGEKIDAVTGGLSYLLYNMHGGGSLGALIGTTVFPSKTSSLDITNQNNQITFTIESTDGDSKELTLRDLVPGTYTREELIKDLNDRLDELQYPTIRAEEWGTGIRLASEDYIISGLKGNMFKIDEGMDIYTSVFYDNIKYGTVKGQTASFTGGRVLATSARSVYPNYSTAVDPKFSSFRFDSSNDTLVFSPNGSKNEYTLKFDHDRDYSLQDICSTMQTFFNDNGLELNAGTLSSTLSSNIYFSGLQITSRVVGVDSDVGINKAKSSAYDTLFVDRQYTVYGSTISPVRETRDDISAAVDSTMKFDTSTLPLKIEEDKNDRFNLTVYEDGIAAKTHTIKLDAKEYNSAKEIADAIQEKIDGIDALKGKIAATDASGTVRLTSASNTVSRFTLSTATNNTGYYDIFVEKKTTYLTTNSTTTGNPPTTTCNTSVIDPSGNITVGASEKKLVVIQDGESREVNLDAKTYTKEEMIKTIEDQLKATAIPKNIIFTTASGYGTATDFSKYDNGYSGYTRTSLYTGIGSSKPNQGLAGEYDYNYGAVTTLNSVNNANFPLTIDENNDKFKISINGVEKELTLGHVTSASKATLASKLQEAIDNAYGKFDGGAEVSLDSSGNIQFTARLKKANGSVINGANTNITIDPTGSSFMKSMHLKEDPAEMTLSVASNFKIEKGKTSFSLKYTDENGNEETLTVNLKEGDGLDQVISAINAQHGTKVTAKKSGSTSYPSITLTTAAKGNKAKIAINKSENAHNATQAIFGLREAKSNPLNKKIQDTVKITADNNRFRITVNGTARDVYLDAGNYSRANFISHLSSKLQAYGITASASGESVVFTGDPYAGTYNGTNYSAVSSFSVAYDSTNKSAMPAIFGQEDFNLEDIKADFTADGRLTLTKGKAGSLYISSTNGSVFQKPTPKVDPVSPTYTSRYVAGHSYIDGVSLNGPVKIDDYNNDLAFTYYEKNTAGTYDTTEIKFTLANGTYSFDELQNALQAELDNCANGKLEALVDKNGVIIRTKATGTEAHIGTSYTNFSGDFYKKVICAATEYKTQEKPVNTPGTYGEDMTYAVGRKDVKNSSVVIRKDVNDKLNLRLQTGSPNQSHTLNMTLDSGTYNSDSLTKMIQEKLNDALVKEGLAENTILAGVGVKLSDVEIIGSNDANALSFRLNTDVKLPTDGQYIIDSISGTAAFSVFYYTEGDISIAHVQGTVPIKNGITLPEGQNDLSFKVDGVDYEFTFTPKTYSSSEFLEEFNKQLEDLDAPIVASEEDGLLKLTHTKYGTHSISDFSGGAKQLLLFRENYRKGDPEDIHIQFSSLNYDNLSIEKQHVNTTSLEINSLAVTRAKYADKAILHLQVAVEKIAAIRSSFGALQNRIEKTIANNRNKAENTQASESAIRDADMAEETLQNSKTNILIQAGESIMAQANSQRNNIVQLLS